jgi:hypothetical protein
MHAGFSHIHRPVSEPGAIDAACEEINRLTRDTGIYCQAGHGSAAYAEEEIPPGVLVVSAGNDLTYCHRLEIAFFDVTTHDLPLHESWPDEPGYDLLHAERQRVTGHTRFYFRNGNTGGVHSVTAGGISYYFGTVYYYVREDMKPGERLAVWLR